MEGFRGRLAEGRRAVSTATEALGGTEAAGRRSSRVSNSEQQDTLSRTDLAEDRTILANERTFAGWMRTSLASVAIGVGFHALFPRMEPPWVPRLIATAFLLLAIVVIVSAERRAAAVMERLSAHVVVNARAMNLRVFSAAITLGAAALIAAIWLVRIN
jgi:putative membrane protein